MAEPSHAHPGLGRFGRLEDVRRHAILFCLIHFGCAQTRASRRTWCLAARGLAKDRAHPGPPTPRRVASECMDTPEVERMTSLELVASTPMTHGVVVLCQLSYIRRSCKARRRPVPGLPCGSLLKSVHRMRWCDPLIAGSRRCASRLNLEMKEARILSESGPLRTELGRSRELRQFSASFSRMHRILRPLEPAKRPTMAGGRAWTLGACKCAGAERGNPVSDAHERTQTLHGSVCPDDVAWFHGLASVADGPRRRAAVSKWGGL